MSTAQDLRDRAGQLRQQLPPRRSATPPQENGRRIGTIERSDGEEIRINWCEYEGKPYVSIRLWKRNDQGQWWPDGKRGMSWRIRELPDLAVAVAELLDLAEAQQRQQPRPMPGRPLANLPPAVGSAEFNEGG
jgi:hypothetical protein